MKRITSIKTALIEMPIMIVVLFFTVACGNSNDKDSKDVAEEHNDAKFNSGDSEKDAQFLVNASEIYLEEIQLGLLAQQNGKSDDVKELGKMMENEHDKSLNGLTKLAATKQATLPTSLTDKAEGDIKKLQEKSGTDFDKEYCDMMVSGHKDAISLFEKMSTDANDPEIKEWASEQLVILRKHLDKAMDCQKRTEKM